MTRAPLSDLPPEVRKDADLIDDGVLDEMDALEERDPEPGDEEPSPDRARGRAAPGAPPRDDWKPGQAVTEGAACHGRRRRLRSAAR